MKAILLLKWERIEPLGVLFAERLTQVVKREGQIQTAELVVPVPSRSGGSPFVALLPHVEAAKLTIGASYW